MEMPGKSVMGGVGCELPGHCGKGSGIVNPGRYAGGIDWVGS